MPSSPERPIPSPRALAVAVVLALAYSTQSGALVRALVSPESWPAVPYLRAIVATGSDLAVMLLLAGLATRRSPRELLALAGLGASLWRPLVWAAGVFAPAVALCLALAEPAEVGWADWLWQGVGGPFTEELLFRGLAIGLLMRLAGWRLVPACLGPALLFGLAHLGQGAGLEATVGIVAITAVGGLLFGWLFVGWGFNLWPPVLLHVGMNTLWLVFDLGENALGGWLGNLQRLLVVALAIIGTLWLAPRKGRVEDLAANRGSSSFDGQ